MALISLSDIHFAYPGGPPVLRGVSLSLNPGERLSLTGANGTGKSTLLRLILGLDRPTSGTLHALGKPRRTEADFHDVRRQIGLVFQDPDDQLFCPTVAEDIAFGPLNLGQTRDQAQATVTRILTTMKLTHLRDRITHKLSGGEKRLITLATVLAMDPQALLLDEPTNALDPENQDRLLSILDSLPQAILLVSHDPAVRARIAPNERKLHNGQLT